ncbi:hypothetical protein [Pediococcus argentinicus]|nr:hypothetical protein [Pediococcus argentinicus]
MLITTYTQFDKKNVKSKIISAWIRLPLYIIVAEINGANRAQRKVAGSNSKLTLAMMLKSIGHAFVNYHTYSAMLAQIVSDATIQYETYGYSILNQEKTENEKMSFQDLIKVALSKLSTMDQRNMAF